MLMQFKMESYKTLIMIQEFASENLLHFFSMLGG